MGFLLFYPTHICADLLVCRTFMFIGRVQISKRYLLQCVLLPRVNTYWNLSFLITKFCFRVWLAQSSAVPSVFAYPSIFILLQFTGVTNFVTSTAMPKLCSTKENDGADSFNTYCNFINKLSMSFKKKLLYLQFRRAFRATATHSVNIII